MTLHSAKGLEFPQVFMAGMEDGLFPSYPSILSDDPTDLEEERRLCYVGITRAMKRLTMTSARMRIMHGEMQIHMISRFVKDIPEELISRNGSDRGDAVHKGRKIQTEDGQSTKKDGLRENGMETGGRTETVRRSPDYQTFAYQQKREMFRAKAYDTKQYEVKKSDSLDYKVGDSVRHVKFGEGIVLQITEGGRDYEVTVEFEKFGVKKMFAAFAKLQKL